jgi:RNA polymerase sigma-70 factor (ECF subfamily)
MVVLDKSIGDFPGESGDTQLQAVELAIEGDEAAFAELYSRHARPIYNLVLRSVRNPTDAEDICQEVWLRVSREIRRLRSPEAFPTWLRRIAAHLCIDAARGRKPNLPLLETVPDGNAVDPEESTARREEEWQVWQALASLTPRQGIALYLREVEGYSYSQIAITLESSLAGIETLLFRARKSLAKSFRLQEAPGESACSRVQTIMAAVIDGEGSPVDRGFVDAHLASCASCRREMAGLSSASRGYAALPMLPALAIGGAAVAGKVAAGTATASPFTLALLKIKAMLAPALAGAAITAGIVVTTTIVADFSSPPGPDSAAIVQMTAPESQPPASAPARSEPALPQEPLATDSSSPFPIPGSGLAGDGATVSSAEDEPGRSASTTPDLARDATAVLEVTPVGAAPVSGAPGEAEVNQDLDAVDVNLPGVDLNLNGTGASLSGTVEVGLAPVDSGVTGAVSADVDADGATVAASATVAAGPVTADTDVGVDVGLDDGLNAGADVSLGASAGGQPTGVSGSIDLGTAPSGVSSDAQGVTSPPSSGSFSSGASGSPSPAGSDPGPIGQVVDTATSAPVVDSVLDSASGSGGSTSPKPEKGVKGSRGGKVSQSLGGLLP